MDGKTDVKRNAIGIAVVAILGVVAGCSSTTGSGGAGGVGGGVGGTGGQTVACIADADTTCVPTDQCHLPGSCQPDTRICSNPIVPNDTLCDAGAGPGSGRCENGTCGVAFPCGSRSCVIGVTYCRETLGMYSDGGYPVQGLDCLPFKSGCTTGDCACVQPSSVPFCHPSGCSGTAATGIQQVCGAV